MFQKSGLASISVFILALVSPCIAYQSGCIYQDSTTRSGTRLIATLSLHIAEFGSDIHETVLPQLQEACSADVKLHSNIAGEVPINLVGNYCYLTINLPREQASCVDDWLRCYVPDMACVRD